MSCISKKIRPQNSLAFYDFNANSLMDGAPNAVSKLENSTVLLYFRLFDAGRSDQPLSARKIQPAGFPSPRSKKQMPYLRMRVAAKGDKGRQTATPYRLH